jgi:hypothetical protein
MPAFDKQRMQAFFLSQSEYKDVALFRASDAHIGQKVQRDILFEHTLKHWNKRKHQQPS